MQMGRKILLLVALLCVALGLQALFPLNGLAAQPERQTISGQQIMAAGQDYLQQQMGTLQGDFVITPVLLAHDILMPVGEVSFSPDLPYGIRYNVPVNVNVTVSVDGRPYSIVQLRFKIKVYQQIVVATRNITTGEILTDDNIRCERRDVGHITTGYVTDISKILGKAARRQVQVGTILNEVMLMNPILIQRGKMVNIVVRTGEIEVMVTGTALQDGSEGELIRVQNNVSRKAISAKVVDEKTVLLQY